MITTVSRTEWLAQHRTVRTLFHNVANGRRVLDAANIWPEAALLEDCDKHQREMWAKATANTVGILGGSPGTGKTYTVAQGIKALINTGIVSSLDIGIGAPTGKAAVRLTEQLQSAGLTNLRARTWHSLLGLGKGEQEFAHNRRNPLTYRVLIGDESSMLDTNMMRSIFAARPRGCHFLLVGDINQLPPVGHGAPLRDLIAAGLPYGELTEIKRNSGGIVEACAAIRDGQPWMTGDNLKLIPTTSPEDQIDAVKTVLGRSEASGRNAIWDCQVLVAVNEKSKLGRKNLNKILQEYLNPNGRGQPGCTFRIGDKVVNTKNGFYSSAGQWVNIDESEVNDRMELYVANGELGEVVDLDDKSMIVRLTSPARVVKVPIAKPNKKRTDSDHVDFELNDSAESSEQEQSTNTGCAWDLGYALSVHKAQGSEVPIAIVMLDDYPGARQVCDRSWLYTAISRAKDKCVLIGNKHVADAMCRRVNVGSRKTFLRETVLISSAERRLGEL